MRDYIRGLRGPVGRRNGWQLAEYAGHRTPDRLQRLLNGARWNADELRDDLQHYVAERLGEPDGILILDDSGFLKKGTTSARVQCRSPSSASNPPPWRADWSSWKTPVAPSWRSPRTATLAPWSRRPHNARSSPCSRTTSTAYDPRTSAKPWEPAPRTATSKAPGPGSNAS
ncbi:transposase [Streptomyces canus]|uniref:transposase n=1 Tax=Streptomyces canus TaxID=58343 RepID=UPI00324B507A